MSSPPASMRFHRMLVEAPALAGLRREYQKSDKRIAAVLSLTQEPDRKHVFDRIAFHSGPAGMRATHMD